MAGERLIGSTGITTSLALPAVVLKRPKKWAMTCLLCKTTVSVLRKKKEKKNLLISFQLSRVDVKIPILYICDNDFISFRNKGTK